MPTNLPLQTPVTFERNRPFAFQTTGPQTTSLNAACAATQRLWQFLIDVMFGNDEPRIWQPTQADQRTEFRVFDPKTNRTLRFGTEQELLSWLDGEQWRSLR